MNDLYPFEGRFLYLDGLRYHYLDEGQGEPVVMVHGNPTWSFFYRNLVHAPCAATIASSCPITSAAGSPTSRAAVAIPTLWSGASRIWNCCSITWRCRGKLTLVVHDWGGMIGLAYAVRHRRAHRPTGRDEHGRVPPAGDEAISLALWLCRNTLLGPLLVRGLNAFCQGAATDCVVRKPLPAGVRDMYLMPYDSWRNRIGVLRFVQDIPLKPRDPSYACCGKPSRASTGSAAFRC